MVQAKQTIRERVWNRLEAAGVVVPGVHGYIPDFVGAELAADRLARLSIWQNARVIAVAPDRAQYPVRLRALQAGKLLYMAVPKLALHKPFYVLDPNKLGSEVADREVAARLAPIIDTDEMQSLSLIVCGSVAVNSTGARLGKGAGYSDREVALFTKAGLINDKTAIVTTVHELQVIDEEIPEEVHDFRVDLIVTQEGLAGPLA
jgi:5-formyltetrahydrofolate cyclo-ligase